MSQLQLLPCKRALHDTKAYKCHQSAEQQHVVSALNALTMHRSTCQCAAVQRPCMLLLPVCTAPCHAF